MGEAAHVQRSRTETHKQEVKPILRRPEREVQASPEGWGWSWMCWVGLELRDKDSKWGWTTGGQTKFLNFVAKALTSFTLQRKPHPKAQRATRPPIPNPLGSIPPSPAPSSHSLRPSTGVNPEPRFWTSRMY